MADVKGTLKFLSSDGNTEINTRVWEDKKPEFILQLVHGMCEYIDRYDDFACFIAKNGGIVYGNDHLGHGYTKDENGTFGYFGKKDGDKLVIKDMHRLTQIAKEQNPGLPLVLMGHSMGGLLSRDYVTRYGNDIDAAIIMGTSGANNLTGMIRFLARVGIIFGRAKKPAKLLSHLAFSKYNDRYEDVRTKNDWITRDRDEVTRYTNDPWCTFTFTDKAAYDFANVVDRVSGQSWADTLPKHIPYLLISGEMDPVGDYGKGVQEVYGWMKTANLSVDKKLFEGARHELLNEINKEEVKSYLLDWIKSKIQT